MVSRSLHVALLCTGCLLLTTGCQGVGKLDLTSWGRDTWQRPGDVVRVLTIGSEDTVADLGAGEGYFVEHLVSAVSSGKVLAVDIDPALVQALSERFAGRPVQAILGRVDDAMLPDGQVDVVLMVNTYHHIEDRPAYFRRLQQDLAPGGRVAILEPNEELRGVLSLFVDEGHTSRAAAVTAEMQAAGYRLEAGHDMLPVQIFQIYVPAP